MGERENFVWADTGSIRIMVHGKGAPTDEEWATFLSRITREVDGRLVAPDRLGAVIYSRGGMATARQRSQLRNVDLSGRLPTLVLMTDSRIVRGVATAIGWLIPALKDFHTLPLDRVQEAAALLSPVQSDQQDFIKVLTGLVERVS